MPNTDAELIDRFLGLHASPYHAALNGGPPWNDGSDVAAVLAAFLFLEPMIFNGGWPAVYYNRIGWTVPIAARGYRLLGLTACAERCELAAELVRKAQIAHPSEDYSSSRWLSDVLMQTIGEHDWSRLDDGWFDLTSSTRAHLARFIRERKLA